MERINAHVSPEMKYLAETVIPSYFVDASQQLKPSSFMDMAQEMAYYAAETMHFGYHDLMKARIAWVLTRMHIRFHRRPRWGEAVDFATWHKEPMGLFFLRDFHMTDKAGATLIDATTCWTVIDVETRRMFRGDAINEIVDPRWTCRDSIHDGAAAKVVVPRDLEPVKAGVHTVGYSDMDLVGHTNNTRYMQWAMDCIDYGYLTSHRLEEATINFNHETKAGDKVDIYHAAGSDRHYVTGEVADDDGKAVRAFAIELVFGQG